jgi:tetratricopeptide (TPR) repeat protein
MVAFGIASAQASPQRVHDRCKNAKAAPDAAIAACSLIIAGGGNAADLARAYWYRAEAGKHKGNYQQAIADYNEAIQRLGENRPDYGYALRDLGFVYELQGEYAEAVVTHKRALAALAGC